MRILTIPGKEIVVEAPQLPMDKVLDGEKVVVEPINCKTCENGAKFAGVYYKTQKTQGPVETFICAPCDRKYEFERIDADKIISPECKGCIDFSDKCNNTEKDFICMGTYDKVLEEIRKESKAELASREAQYNEYLKTSVCPQHFFIKSKPYRTSEGEFPITSCVICKETMATVGKDIVRGTLSEVLVKVFQKGQIHSIIKKKATDGINKMLQNVKPVNIGDLGIDSKYANVLGGK